MPGNSFISNFKKQGYPRLLLSSRAFFIALGLFCLSQLVCLKIAKTVLPLVGDWADYKRNWARGKVSFGDKVAANKKIVFFMGDSQIATSIIPELFDRENSGSTYSFNLGLSVFNLQNHYFLLKDYLKHNPAPDYIITPLYTKNEIRPKWKFGSLSVIGAGFYEDLQYAFRGQGGAVLLRYFCPSRNYWGELRRYIIGRLLTLLPAKTAKWHRANYLAVYSHSSAFPGNWEYIYDTQFVAPEKYSRERKELLRRDRGYFAMDGYAKEGSPPEGSLLLEEIDTAVYDPFSDDFFALAEKHNIKVILIAIYGMEGRVEVGSVGADTPQEWQALKKRFRNIDFGREGFIPRQYHPVSFVDSCHLRARAAVDYTREIARQFREVSAGLKDKADN